MSTDKELTRENLRDTLSRMINPGTSRFDSLEKVDILLKEYGQQEETIGYERGKKEANEWISIYSSLPPNRTSVLIYLAGWPQGSINMGYYQDKRFWLHGDLVDHITHWMPLPAPPQQGKEETV